MKLEVCIDNIEDAIICNKYLGTISRVELNLGLGLGGLSPNIELVKKTREILDESIVLVCMIRSRAGDFNYSDLEFELMYEQAQNIIDYCDGLVFGALNEDKTIDIEKTKKILNLCQDKNKEFVFHRAIDVCKEYFEAINLLDDLGVDRVLTSGHEKTAVLGLDNLKKLNCKLEILAGCGISPENVEDFLDFQVHGSFSKTIHTEFGDYQRIDEEKIIKLKGIMDARRAKNNI